jgi:uncharacterized protein with HEPN domain
MPPLDDEVRIAHLIEAAEKAVAFAAERDRAALDQDELFRLALTKLVEIVGEAVSRSATRGSRHTRMCRGGLLRGCGID